MVKHKDRLSTDALREIRNTFSRYLSILVLAALAVAFLSGLRTTAPDMQYTADNYYDRTHLMDGYVLSTLGLTQEDLTQMLRFANTAAYLVTTRKGAIRSMPEREQVEALLERM